MPHAVLDVLPNGWSFPLFSRMPQRKQGMQKGMQSRRTGSMPMFSSSAGRGEGQVQARQSRWGPRAERPAPPPRLARSRLPSCARRSRGRPCWPGRTCTGPQCRAPVEGRGSGTLVRDAPQAGGETTRASAHSVTLRKGCAPACPAHTCTLPNAVPCPSMPLHALQALCTPMPPPLCTMPLPRRALAPPPPPSAGSAHPLLEPVGHQQHEVLVVLALRGGAERAGGGVGGLTQKIGMDVEKTPFASWPASPASSPLSML